MFAVINSSNGSCFHVRGMHAACCSDFKILWLLGLQEVKKTDLGNLEQLESTTSQLLAIGE